MAIKISAVQRARLQQELIEAKEESKAAAERMAIAKEEGDFSENSGLDASRALMELSDCRIKEINEILEDCEDASVSNGPIIDIGDIVQLEKLIAEEKKYQDIGYFLIDSTSGFGIVETDSPLGKAIKGTTGGVVTIQTAFGDTIQYRVTKNNSAEALETFMSMYPTDMNIFQGL